ncbi:NADH dehydrogenase [Actibacterium mucosum KCTC 23349]|uniref:NADH dehydrogenase n=1 Tax=Actibacterium mucosum KCTC 23349 TaxID=1454373 RepID=A0A037ZGI7_9RHOB|nr:hypothetical protein [Actibacterium mucosum]KAJ55570.1 NADH dehydrogenase [Actibacterium mucosum KCTC 23349]
MGFIWWIIISALTIVPLWRLMPKFRLPEMAALICIIPFGVLILLWVMAFRDDIKVPGVDK